MKNSTLLLSFICLSFAIQAQTKSFPNLRKFYIDTVFKDYVFGYDSQSIRLINIGCEKLSKKDPWRCDPSDAGEGITKLAAFTGAGITDTLFIFFSQGASDDPYFTIGKKNGKIVGQISAQEFYINSNGTFYTSGHTNNMFQMRRKFQLGQDTIKEITQPYYYVGLKSRTVSSLTLYTTKTGNDIVVQVPKDYEVEVLLCEPNADGSETLFLVRTEFGLVGWLRLSEKYAYETPVKGLIFYGD